MKTKSFTLIELLVVIVIIGILAGVIIVSTSSSISKANFAKAQAFSNTVQQELLLNLVSEWTFDNASNLGEDSWGNNDGTVYGPPTIKSKEECVYGTCLYLDHYSEYINCGNRDEYNLAKTDHFISFWINLSEATTTPYILNRRVAGTPGSGYLIYLYTSNYLYFEERVTMGSNSSISANFSSFFNSWHLISASVDISSKEKKLYIDGKVVAEDVYEGDLIDSNIDLYIGGNGTSTHNYIGSIDDVRIYNATLSTAQIKQEYIAGLNSLLANDNISKEEYDQRLNNLAYDKK